jgi:hypothetical protein
MMLKGWRPTEDFVVAWKDKTAEPRTREQLDAMVEEMRVIANKYDFDLSQYGGEYRGMTTFPEE